MRTLFHGSYVSVPTPFVKLSRKKLDFGQGFYLTKLYDQAKSWAEVIAERKGRNQKPIVSSYSLNFEAIVADGYRVKIFETYDMEWLDYVVDCRKGGEM